MNEPRNDDERLSALLDGRITDPQRREMLAHLSTSDDDYTVFADTAIILRQLEEGARAGGRRRTAPFAIPPSMRRRGRLAVPVGVAALLVAILWGWRESAAAAAAGDPVHLAARLETSGRGLPPGWTVDRPWSVSRGSGAVPVRTPEERSAASAQAGAMLTDLAVAIRAGNADDTRLLASQVRARFDPVAGRGTPLPQIAERAGAPPASLEPLLERATDRLEGNLEKDPLRLGAWVEAASLAAHRGDEAFFEARASRRMLERAQGLTEERPDARAALDRVRADLAAETRAWDAVKRDLNALLKVLAS